MRITKDDARVLAEALHGLIAHDKELGNNEPALEKAFKMLTGFIIHSRDKRQSNVNADMDWPILLERWGRAPIKRITKSTKP